MFVVEQLSFDFPSGIILDRVSFKAQAGTATCLLGGNGSGKTTLFNLITGFLQPDIGSVRLDETELTGRTPFRISRFGIARTFQDLRLIGKLSVRENILFALPQHPSERLANALLRPSFHHERDVIDNNKVDMLLSEYFLTEVTDQPASEISYGQQKLLTLACCSAMEASLILLDEPVAGITSDYQDRIVEILASLKSAGKTILLIEHQPAFLERTGDAFLFLQAGRLYHFDTLAELIADPVSHDALN